MMLGDGCCGPGRGENGNPNIVYTSVDKSELLLLKDQTEADIWTVNINLDRKEDMKDSYRIRTERLPNLEQFREPYQTVLNGSAKPKRFWSSWNGITDQSFEYSTWKLIDDDRRMKSKKARIPEDLEITPELMMAWYLGDGTYDQNNQRPLITAEFPEEDYQRIQSQLEEKVFDHLENPKEGSSIKSRKGGWSLSPLNPDYLQADTQLGYTDQEEHKIINEGQNGSLQRDPAQPLRPDMVIDRKILEIDKPGHGAFFDYLPDHDDWDNVMPRKFPN